MMRRSIRVLLLWLAAAAAFTALAPRRTATVQMMANNPGALKRIKTNERNRVRNAAWRSKVRTWTRKTNEAIERGDVDEAKECARMATSMIDRATRRKIYHKNWAARNKSRLSKKVIKLILESRGEL
ncbi:hypothetical protein CTAYLR_006074 [Chrysophaeum taylorii]|uniref:30S ribosomal protein S20, chloroplastic n=1 Tax=Chrysophaeum taylorii TaxID=2483200 RepID=A0AAD7UKQ3_9STRA|nr:hypothetical protein CTAYLR_006074 [Chrysophaeum taylorii]